jgi:hypothetical protein
MLSDGGDASDFDGLAGVTADLFESGIRLITMGVLLTIGLGRLKLTTIADSFRVQIWTSAKRVTANIQARTFLLRAAMLGEAESLGSRGSSCSNS